MTTKRVFMWPLLVMAAAPTTAAGAESQAAVSPADAAVYRRIETLRRAAGRFRLDGFDRDWRAIPQLSDPRNDVEDPTRDVVAAAVAPTDDDLWLLVRTAGNPSTDPFAFYFEVDLLGAEEDDDFLIAVESRPHGPILRLYDEQMKAGPPIPLPHARLVIQRVVEMRIPYGDIAAAMPREAQPQIRGRNARPWVHVRVFSWDGIRRTYVDRGPLVGSFRLIPTPYPLDTTLPERPAPPVAIPMPVKGQWFVSQGPFGRASHQHQWAYDLLIVDHEGYQSQPPESRQNADYHAWGQPVFAPVAGQVLFGRGDVPDRTDQKRPHPGDPANYVSLDTGGGRHLVLSHLQAGSLAVRPREHISAGQQIARVGNSGYSDAPHLHLELRGRFGTATQPVALRNVRVGLNPSPRDPWARELPTWEPRYGYFVEAVGWFDEQPQPAAPR